MELLSVALLPVGVLLAVLFFIVMGHASRRRSITLTVASVVLMLGSVVLAIYGMMSIQSI